jgi:hypothetical protein
MTNQAPLGILTSFNEIDHHLWVEKSIFTAAEDLVLMVLAESPHQ